MIRSGYITNSADDSISLALHLWSSRSSLNKVQKRGFGNFFYVALLSHIESLLTIYLQARIHAAESLIPWTDLPMEKPIKENGVTRNYPTTPLKKSLESMILAYESDLESAPIGKLIELYKKIIGTPLSEAVSKQTHKHITALADLRNVFAHGRSIVIEIPCNGSSATTLKNTPLQKPVQLLIEAGLIDSLNYDSNSHSKFAMAFYSDNGMKCFWDAARDVDKALRICEQLNIFTRSLLPKELPELES